MTTHENLNGKHKRLNTSVNSMNMKYQVCALPKKMKWEKDMPDPVHSHLYLA